MRALAVGVMGHVDHGKTALVKALTGRDTDRLKEERERGVSIVAGYALLRRPGVEIDLVDLPGHERFLRAMVSGATGIGGVLLAVAANEGVKPQTLEHLEIARLLGVRRAVVALTKCDLVSPDRTDRRGSEIRALAAGFGLADAPILKTALPDGTGIAALADALCGLAAGAPDPRDDGLPFLPIDRVFAVPGFGPVVTGTLRRGHLAVGDRMEIQPGGAGVRVRSLQIHGGSVATAPPGRRVAVALRGIDLRDLRRGLALAAPSALAGSAWLDVLAATVPGAPRPMRDGDRLRLLVCTTEVDVRLRLLDRTELAPGESAFAQLHCTEPVALPSRERFVLRLSSPSLTLGGGEVLDAIGRRRRRNTGVPASLAALAGGELGRALLARLEEAGPAGEPVDSLARFLGLARARVERHLARIGAEPRGGERVVHPEVWAALTAALQEAVGRHHRERPLDPGLPREQLAPALPPGADPAVAQAAADALVARGVLTVQRGALRQPGFTLDGRNADVAEGLAQALREGGLSPPDEAVLVGPDSARREALHFLAREGIVVRATDRVQNRTVLFHRDAIAAARSRLVDRFPAGTPFLAGEAGSALGISRKFSIPLLEHLDAVRFTRRQGDRRVIVADGRKGGDRR